MTLTAAQIAARDGKVTASFLPALMEADQDRIMAEWRRLVGDPEYAEPDFSADWAVQFGSFIETFALDWHQRATRLPITRRGEVVVRPGRPHVSCTLDGWREADNVVIDCKAVGPWRKLPDVIAHYTPQMVVQRACLDAAGAVLLIVHGGQEPAEHLVTWTAEYEAAVWTRVEWFWECVQDLVAPFEVAPIIAPPPAIKEADMSASNLWCDAAATWLESAGAARAFAEAAQSIKALIEPDVKRAFGAGIVVSRAKNGALTIKEDRP